MREEITWGRARIGFQTGQRPDYNRTILLIAVHIAYYSNLLIEAGVLLAGNERLLVVSPNPLLFGDTRAAFVLLPKWLFPSESASELQVGNLATKVNASIKCTGQRKAIVLARLRQ